MSVVELYRKDGWGIVGQKIHFFLQGISLCERHMLYNNRRKSLIRGLIKLDNSKCKICINRMSEIHNILQQEKILLLLNGDWNTKEAKRIAD